jgi:predicted TIM-barrel enzyme
MGFDGVQNFPTVGLIDGVLRQNLEETGMSYDLEVAMIQEAHGLDMLTCPYVFDADSARAMAQAGADVLVAHLGLTTKGSIGARTALTLDQSAARVQAMHDAARAVRNDVFVICHGGPIAEPEDVEYVLAHTTGVDGFFGASSIERFATEAGIEQQARRFRTLQLPERPERPHSGD